jgi:hypothetical protein
MVHYVFYITYWFTFAVFVAGIRLRLLGHAKVDWKRRRDEDQHYRAEEIYFNHLIVLLAAGELIFITTTASFTSIIPR